MTLLIIILLILLGWFLVFAEVFFIPGISVLLLIGCALLFSGVSYAFMEQGYQVGWMTLGATLLLNFLTFYLAFKRGVWKKFTLHKHLEGRVNTFDATALPAGTAGLTRSKVAPTGWADFHGETVEVQSSGSQYIPENTAVEIVKADAHKIVIKPKS